MEENAEMGHQQITNVRMEVVLQNIAGRVRVSNEIIC